MGDHHQVKINGYSRLDDNTTKRCTACNKTMVNVLTDKIKISQYKRYKHLHSLFVIATSLLSTKHTLPSEHLIIIGNNKIITET